MNTVAFRPLVSTKALWILPSQKIFNTALRQKITSKWYISLWFFRTPSHSARTVDILVQTTEWPMSRNSCVFTLLGCDHNKQPSRGTSQNSETDLFLWLPFTSMKGLHSQCSFQELFCWVQVCTISFKSLSTSHVAYLSRLACAPSIQHMDGG